MLTPVAFRSPIRRSGQQREGDRMADYEGRCAVCNMAIRAGKAVKDTMRGKTYLFCSEYCRKKWQKGKAGPW